MPDLYLSHLSLSQYRSYAGVQLTLDARPVAIYGANGAGKTNIIEAVSLLSPGRGLRRNSAESMTRSDAGAWKVTAHLQADMPHEIVQSSEAGQPRRLRLDDKPAPQTDLAKLLRVLWLIPSMDRLWIEGADGRRRFLDRITMSFTPSHAESVLAYEKHMRERNQLLKDQVRDAHWYLAIERQMAEAGAAIHQNRLAALQRLQVAQDQAQTSFPTATLDLVSLEADIPETAADLESAFSESRFRDIAAGRTLVGPHRADMSAHFVAKNMPAKDCSTGEQKALLVSVILANARAVQEDTDAPPILLLDEVAAHLDADRRAALFDEICALGAQAWMTGTGEELFQELGTRAQYLEVTENAGASQIITA